MKIGFVRQHPSTKRKAQLAKEKTLKHRKIHDEARKYEKGGRITEEITTQKSKLEEPENVPYISHRLIVLKRGTSLFSDNSSVEFGVTNNFWGLIYEKDTVKGRVFETTSPLIMWDGEKEPPTEVAQCVDGTIDTSANVILVKLFDKSVLELVGKFWSDVDEDEHKEEQDKWIKDSVVGCFSTHVTAEGQVHVEEISC